MIFRYYWLLATFGVLALLFWSVNFETVFAAQNYGSGYYINLSGSGADLNGNIGNYNDEADCQQSNGICNAKNRNTGQNYSYGRVDKYICNGKVTNCDNTNSPNSVVSVTSGYSQSISGASCSQTVQLDVFDGSALHGYMTWYSGDCAYGGTSTQNTVTTCNNRILSQSTLETEIRNAGYPGPWDLASELAAFNRAACPSGAPAPSPYIAPTPPPVVYGGTTTNTTYVYVYPSPLPQPTPTIQYVNVNVPQSQTPTQKVYLVPKSLPKTGPENFAILLAGFPIGYIFRKIAHKISEKYII